MKKFNRTLLNFYVNRLTNKQKFVDKKSHLLYRYLPVADGHIVSHFPS